MIQNNNQSKTSLEDIYLLNKIFYSTLSIFKLTKEEIIIHDRHKRFVAARQIYCYLACKHTKACLTEIGNKIHRDHSTVVHSKKTASYRIDERFNPDIIYKKKTFAQLMKDVSEDFNPS